MRWFCTALLRGSSIPAAWPAVCAGCAGSPAQKTETLARNGGASVARVGGDGFEHVVFEHNLGADDSTLHIYFSGDGTPFIRPTQIAADPTPRDPLEVRLMLEDPAPSVFIGRPCYQGLATAPGCNATLWSVARYSESVVASMTAAVNGVLDASRATRIMLIGYSGGGVLALLVAQRVVSDRHRRDDRSESGRRRVGAIARL